MSSTLLTISGGDARELRRALDRLQPGEAEGDSAQGLHWAGLQALSLGDGERAANLLQQAVAAAPGDGVLHLNLGNAHLMRKDHPNAIASFRRALELLPSSAEARYNLGLACLLGELWQDALLCFREALRFEPEHTQAIQALGYTMEKMGRADQAIVCYRELVARMPDSVSGWNSLAMALAGTGESSQADECLDRAFALDPNHAQTRLHRGLLAFRQGDLSSAESEFQQALELNPDLVEAWCNLSAVYSQNGRGHASGQAALEALRRQPGHIGSRANLAFALRLQGALADSLDCYRVALALAPRDPQLHWNYSLALLAAGQWAEGWREYQWRFEAGITEPRTCVQPLWDGQPTGGRVLVWAEQGLGDTLQFLRYLPQVWQRAASVVFETQPRLQPLLAQSPLLEGIEICARGEQSSHYDSHIPLLSLPQLFTTAPSDIEWPGPYLRVPQDRLNHWRETLSPWDGKRKIGIAWAGNPAHKNDRLRSIAPEHFNPLATLPGVALFSLQRDTYFTPEGFHRTECPENDILDTAAIIQNLDLVITVDTMVAHLAGGLGAPVWLLLACMADWRWLAEGETTPWYGTMRLFRQPESGDWKWVIDQVGRQLEGLG